MVLATAGNLCTTMKLPWFRRGRPRSGRLSCCASLPFHFFAIVAFLAAPAGFVLDRLLFQMVESFVDGSVMSPGLGQADQRSIAGADGDFRFVAVLFDGQDYLGFEFVA